MSNFLDKLVTNAITKVKVDKNEMEHLLTSIKTKLAENLIQNLRDNNILITPKKYASFQREVVKLQVIQKLPVPRLQLRWEELPPEALGYSYDYACHYELILPVSEYRSKEKELAIPMSCTFVGSRTIFRNGMIETPSADGINIQMDAKSLNLPAFVIYDEYFTCLHFC